MRLPPELQWQTKAACTNADPEIFFSEGRHNKPLEYCNNCPVKKDCLNYAVTEQIDHGIWGGMTPGQRRNAKGKWGRPTGLIEHGTYNGYRMHHRHGNLPVCEPCRLANNHYAADINRRRKHNQKGNT